jgi:hypothetical protein
VEDAVGCFDVAEERFFHADAERGEEEAAGHALLVHEGDAGVAVAVGGADGLERAERAADVVGGAAAAEVLVEAAGAGDGVEERVRDEAVDALVDHQARLAVDLHPLHAALGQLGVDVTGEGVGRLVVVVVGVEELEPEVGHGQFLLQSRN